jgi:hypothetical protein
MESAVDGSRGRSGGEGTDVTFAKSRMTGRRSWICAALLILTGLGLITLPGRFAVAGATVDLRKMPMRFEWVSCDGSCRGWISAVGVVTADTPQAFDDFAKNRKLDGATMVLDSSGGSVNDAITLGRRWRGLGLLTTVGETVPRGRHAAVEPDASCESMCVFLLLSGKVRYVPEQAHVRVHQIWMGDRAENAQAASYSAQDLMIVERDVGRLAKYTFDMGGTGDLLALALSVPPWEQLHEMSPSELRDAGLVTTDVAADVFPQSADIPMAMEPKPIQDRFASDAQPVLATSTRTAEAMARTGGRAARAADASQ